MKLLIYKIRLAFHLGLFVLGISANFSSKTKPVILGLFIIGLLAVIGGITLLSSKPTSVQVVTITTVVPKNSDLYSIKNLKTSDLENEVVFWENILKIQPQSRDVLLNLSRLYSALNLDGKALEYKAKAVNIDPNNPLFE